MHSGMLRDRGDQNGRAALGVPPGLNPAGNSGAVDKTAAAEPTPDQANATLPALTVESEQVRLLHGSRAIIFVNLIVAAVAAAVLGRAYPGGVAAVWFVVMAVANSARAAVLITGYHRNPPPPEGARAAGMRYTVGAVLVGCLWGLLGTVPLVTTDLALTSFAVVAVGGMSAGAAMRNSDYLPAFYGFMVPAVTPLILIEVASGSAEALGMAAMLAAFAVVQVMMAQTSNHRSKRDILLLADAAGLNRDLNQLAADLTRAEVAARDGEATFRALAENDIAGIAITTEPGEIAYLNPRLAQMLGYSVADLTGRNAAELITQADRNAATVAFAKVFTGEVKSADAMLTFRQRSGDPLSVLVQGKLTSFKGVRALFLVALDITQRRAADEKLLFANTLLSTIMETLPDAILVVDQNSRIIRVNAQFGELWRVPPELIAAGDDAPILAAVTRQIKDPQGFFARVKHLYQHPDEAGREDITTRDGRIIDRYTATLKAPDGYYLGRVWFFRDITDQRRSEAEIRHSARHDVVTGLANCRVFMDAVAEATARAGRGGKGFAVLYLDLDHFKDVNDTLGHPAGDQLLVKVAERLQENARSTDVVARFGGDEFAVLETDIDEAADAAILAEKLVAAIAQPFDIDGGEIRTGVSIGIAVHEPGTPRPCCRTPTSRFTAPRRRVAAATASSRKRWTGRCAPASR
jgi:diguanylate cyclase (GGDEF)-like protein/PAS domain S-box-containing protein